MSDKETSANPVVLIVDDSPLDRRLATGLLANRGGLQTTLAANGREALESIKRQPPALVVTDLQMPEMDGLELVVAVRQAYPELPVVLMTANGSEDIAIQALQKGATGYVAKRSLAEELAPTVERLLQAAQTDRRRQRLMEWMRELDCRLELENDATMIPLVVAHFQEQAWRMGLCDHNSKIRIGVALEEALLNAIYHGNLDLSSDLRQDGSDRFYQLAIARRSEQPWKDRRVILHARLDAESATFVIRDEGNGFDVSKLPDPTDPENLLKPSGRGVLMMQLFMDEVRYNDRGNEVTMIRRKKR
jgi:CheY-like chemotaxis protein/anti-sigma regulatory factor (Ser/Thr protein kinase)